MAPLSAKAAVLCVLGGATEVSAIKGFLSTGRRSHQHDAPSPTSTAVASSTGAGQSPTATCRHKGSYDGRINMYRIPMETGKLKSEGNVLFRVHNEELSLSEFHPDGFMTYTA